jgi:hypothetical protein
MPFVVLPVLIWAIILGSGFALAARFIRAIENRGGQGSQAEVTAIRERMARLEETLETITSQMGRLEESQRFTMQLLDGRTEPAESADSEKRLTDG